MELAFDGVELQTHCLTSHLLSLKGMRMGKKMGMGMGMGKEMRMGMGKEMRMGMGMGKEMEMRMGMRIGM